MLGNADSASESQAGESFCSDVKNRIEPDQRMLGGIFKYRYRATHQAQTLQNSALQTSPIQSSIKSSPTHLTNNSYALN